MTYHKVPLLFVDLDGTVRKGVDELGRFVNGPADVEVFPEAVAMMQAWHNAGGRIVGVSNQGGIALGHMSVADNEAAIEETREQAKGLINPLVVCPHHPDAEHIERCHCWCRKPSPGMLFAAVQHLREHYPGEVYSPDESWMVGDRPEDRLAAERAGVAFLGADLWRSFASDPDNRAAWMMGGGDRVG